MSRLHPKRLTKLQALREEFALNHYPNKNSDACYKALPAVVLTPTNDVEARLWHSALTELLSRSKVFNRFATPEVYELLRQLTRGINQSLKEKYGR